MRLLRRWPDLEAPELFASDAADALMLAEANPRGDVVVVGDRYGALTLGALDRGATSVRVHQDAVTGERALAKNAEATGFTDFSLHDLDESLLAGATLVLLRLPRSLDALDEIATLIARVAHPDVHVVAGGMVKHMSLGMNEVLRTYFGEVHASLAHRKARVLHARLPQSGTTHWPKRVHHAARGLSVVAHGAAFAGTNIDRGTALLLDCLDRMPAAEVALDLGCGTGILATAFAQARPDARVFARDRSAAAVRSALATTAANGVFVDVRREDAALDIPDAAVDLVLLNPPFHSDTAVHTGIALHLFAEAARVLRPGGELWCVWNSHVRYRQSLESIVGPTRQITRTPTYTVTVSARG